MLDRRHRSRQVCYDRNKGAGSVGIEGARGAFRFSTGAQNKGDIKIRTPSGTLGIRG
jgi:hypothetical protein